MPNFDGEWELRIFYTTTPAGFTAMQHTLTIDVNVTSSPDIGDPFTSISATSRDTGETFLDTLVDGLVAILDGEYPATTSFARAELWFIAEGTTDAVWYSVYEIGVVGANPADETPAHQLTLTFRTSLGGVARLQLMESSNSGNGKTPYPYPAGVTKDLADFITNEANPFRGRDNGWILSSINESQGQNERLFRKRYRDS